MEDLPDVVGREDAAASAGFREYPLPSPGILPAMPRCLEISHVINGSLEEKNKK